MFALDVITWYEVNKRDLPWRNTRNPYKIWLSEIILQQTRVNQGLDYYYRFIETFPSIVELANAKEDTIMKLWQGLGYYSRARNLHATAQFIRDKFKGRFPDNYDDIISLKGIGKYTASAIVSFCFDQPYPVVDGNVYRVLSRVFGVKLPIDSSEGQKAFYKLANSLIDKKNPGIYNQAIMEFGAMHCMPHNPDCQNCPLVSKCYAFKKKQVGVLPLKTKTVKQRDRYFHYLVMRYKDKVLLQKRTGKDIWKNLYDFPLVEEKAILNKEKVMAGKSWKELTKGQKIVVKSVSSVYKHILTHQLIYSTFWELELKGGINKKLRSSYLVIEEKELKNFAVPRLIDKYLQSRKLQG